MKGGNRYFRIPVDRFLPRLLRPDELPDVRRVWWHWRRREVVKLPAEKGIIPIEGERQ